MPKPGPKKPTSQERKAAQEEASTASLWYLAQEGSPVVSAKATKLLSKKGR